MKPVKVAEEFSNRAGPDPVDHQVVRAIERQDAKGHERSPQIGHQDVVFHLLPTDPIKEDLDKE